MRSFTLIEILVAVVIMGLVLGGIFWVFRVGNTAYNSNVRLLSLQQGARRAMDLMVRELRETNDDPAGGSLIFNSPADIAFNIPDPVAVWTGLRYFLDGNAQIIRQDAAGNQNILARNIANLRFIPQPPLPAPIEIVEIEIRAVDLQRPGPADDLQFFLREKVSLRN